MHSTDIEGESPSNTNPVQIVRPAWYPPSLRFWWSKRMYSVHFEGQWLYFWAKVKLSVFLMDVGVFNVTSLFVCTVFICGLYAILCRRIRVTGNNNSLFLSCVVLLAADGRLARTQSDLLWSVFIASMSCLPPWPSDTLIPLPDYLLPFRLMLVSFGIVKWKD